MIERIELLGMFLRACSVPGETRADDVFPAHPNSIRLSRDRWLVVYATRGWRGLDDDRSVVAQIRSGSPIGPLVRERCLAQTTDDWDPLGDGSSWVKQCGHPVAFGVPKGTVIAGRTPPHANLFAITWRTSPVPLNRKANRIPHWDEVRYPKYHAVEWMQFRLNDAEDDLEIVRSAVRLRQRGYDTGTVFCEREDATAMNQSFVNPVPLDAGATQWVVTEHFSGRLAAVRFAYQAGSGRYEWVQTGPFLNDPKVLSLSEASTLRYGDSWIVCGRTPWGHLSLAWFRTDDLMGPPPPMALAKDIHSDAPHTAYASPDGQVRVFGGDKTLSPYGLHRCPLFCWDIDPDRGFAAGPGRVVFDSLAAGVSFRRETGHTVDMAKLISHGGGRVQHLLFRVRNDAMNFPSVITRARITPEEKAASGIYAARLVYTQDQPSEWQFDL